MRAFLSVMASSHNPQEGRNGACPYFGVNGMRGPIDAVVHISLLGGSYLAHDTVREYVPSRVVAWRAAGRTTMSPTAGYGAMDTYTPTSLSDQLRAIGVTKGGVLLVHTSFKAVGPVEGGPLGLIHALRRVLGSEGTLVMPTMTDGESVFDPRVTPTVGMGVVAETFWRQPGVTRSTHPGGSFAAVGPHADFICAPQPLSPPHGPDSPVGRVHDLGGQVLLLGVTHSEDTTVHLAEVIAGVPYSTAHPCVVEDNGVARVEMIAETDHCCVGFRQLDVWLRARVLQREGKVGNADARLARAQDIVDVAVEELRRNPLVFLCGPERACAECDAARGSVRAPTRN